MCHTATRGCCGVRCMIVSPNITKSSRIVRKHDFGSVSVMFKVAAEQENRRRDENAYRCVRLFDELSHVVSSDFSHDHGNIQWIRACGNPPKNSQMLSNALRSSQILREVPKILQNFTIRGHQFSAGFGNTFDTSNKHNRVQNAAACRQRI